MGIDDPVPYSKVMDISSEEEIARIKKWATKRDMLMLPKDTTPINGQAKEVSWYNGSSSYKPTNLDHVLISDHMDIRDQTGTQGNVSVFGWPKLPENEWGPWLEEYSDHAMLYFEVW